METKPVFIQSLFRSASTYFFQKFRSLGPQFSCYQEPFNEALVALNDPSHHGRLLESPVGSPLRHPPLDKPYFFEYWSSREHLRGLFRPAFAYQQYFVGEHGQLPGAQCNYLSALLEHAPARPVLQFCRSSGRAGQLRREFGGLHIHLWREPRAQWWSYKVTDYFDSVSQRIYRSEHLPEALRQIGALTGLDAPRYRYLRPCDNYLMFYGLWLDAWLRLRSHADLSINIDEIAVSAARNTECASQLSELAGQRIDLSDLRASGMVFSSDERAFYADIESAVNSVFVQTRRGTSRSVAAASDAARGARRMHATLAHNAAAERNVRQAALAMMERLAGKERADRQAWLTRLSPVRLRGYWRSARAAAPSPMALPVSAESSQLP